MSYRDPKDFARQTSADFRAVRGALRRLVVTLTEGAKWQLSGRKVTGDQETVDVEVFGGIGYHARPRASGGSPEAVVVSLGGNGAPVAIATRDEQTRQTVAGSLDPDETAIHNSQAIVVVKANGTVEIRSANGIAVPLALKSDVEALRTTFIDHTHTGTSVSGGAVTTIVTTSVPAFVVGSSILKGE